MKKCVLAAAIGIATVALLQPGVSAFSWTGPMVTVTGSCNRVGPSDFERCTGFSGDGGAATSAKLKDPRDVVVDASGNLYIADSQNNRIRRVGLDGVMTTIAGDGTAASAGDGGLATAAQLNRPSSIASDSAGNLYVAELNGHRIRKIASSTGIITTVAGTGTAGYNGDGGAALLAQLNAPRGVAVDGGGNIYIADTANFRVRRVAALDGTIATIAGTGTSGFSGDGGPAVAAQISEPYSVDVDAGGNVYVADPGNHRVRVVAGDSALIVTVAGTGVAGIAGDGGPATDAQLNTPEGVAVDAAGNLYIADRIGRVRRVNSTNHYIRTVAGAGTLPCERGCDGRYPATAVSLVEPVAVAVDQAGNLYIPAWYGLVQKAVAVPPYLTADVPLLGDFDGDGRSDFAVWSIADGTWKWVTAASGFDETGAATKQWGNRSLGDVPLLGDVDGDGRADLVIWRASTGTWFWLTSSTGYNYAASGAKQWGNQTLGDVPMLGDIDGDGRADLVVWRESTGGWYWLTSASGYSYGFAGGPTYGSQGNADVPLLGRFDGDQIADLALWSSTPCCSGTFYWTASSTGSEGSMAFGTLQLSDRPFFADIDGDGLSEIGVWRPLDGTWYWRRSSSAYAVASGIQWGNNSLGDIPLAADIDGDGAADLAVWRASSRTWYWLTSSSGYSYSAARLKPWS